MGTRKIGKGGLAIRAAGTQAIEPLKKTLEDKGLSVKIPQKQLPKIKVTDIPTDWTKENLMENLWKCNFQRMVKQAEFNNTVKPLFAIKQRYRERVSWVLLVTAEAWKGFKLIGKIQYPWHAGGVYDYWEPTRCFKCQRFGHITTKCRDTVDTCSTCAQEGHNYKACKAQNERNCANCLRSGLRHDHSVGSETCPFFVSQIERNKSYIDYGFNHGT